VTYVSMWFQKKQYSDNIRMNLQKLKKFVQFDTAGWIASSALLLCAISGVLLAIPYDFTRAHQSVSEILLFNPTGTFIWNFHYWSAELFLIFFLLHIYDHLKKSTDVNIRKRRTWLILCLVVIFAGYEMLSGFILKGDAAGIQARRILASLLRSIPVLGKMLSSAFAGSDDNWQIIYIQHVATGTIFLFIGIYEHVKTLWPKLKTFVVMLLIVAAFSLFLRAPMGLPESTQIKGPWFFIGIQELLHFTSHPGLVVLLFLIILVALFQLPVLHRQWRSIVKKGLFAVGIVYLLVTIMVFLFRGENWEWTSWKSNTQIAESFPVYDPVSLFQAKPVQFIPENQKTEGCLVCHSSMKGLSESHNPAVIGCFACHKGDPFSSDKLTAHRKMITVPGNFSNVRQTCGTQNCHPEIAGRMLNSLMTTQSGIIGVDKYVFQETASLNDTFHIKNLGHSAADTHIRNLCAGCHLGKEKSTTGNAAWLERGGGCNACHLHYNDKASTSMKRMQSKTSVAAEEIHPSIDIQVSNDRCKSCHSRSGRISLNYEGWNETTLKKSQATDSIHFKVLPDERVLEFVQADIHHQKGMACIDCHGSYEIMGDGKHPIHKEDAVNVQCIDCHPSADGKPNSVVVGKLPDRESQMIAWLRKYDTKNRVVVTAKGRQPLMNTKVDSLGQILLTDKLNGKVHLSKPLSSVCTKGKGHNRLSCRSCHTAWVPQCIGCHNVYEKESSGFDLLTGKPTRGTWVEFAGKNFAEPPVLGISEKAESKVVTAMPGMVMSIDQESFNIHKGKSFHRLYAPASGHTTVRDGRSCKSCHNSPLAIGFGRGKLIYKITGKTGKWIFEPRFALNEHDSLPEDAWIGFLKEAKSPYSTRSDLRPFNVKEQKHILEVGSCLTCHDEKSKVIGRALEDYEQTLANRSKQCILPEIK
jgi:quinol-cytochrome oxidoreductase complex cytochrome b subunit